MVNFKGTDPPIENNLNDICIDHQGRVIFASNNGTVYLADYDGQELVIHHRIEEKNGLHGNTINWLVPDPRGFLWIGTNLGLNCLDMNQLVDTGQCRFRLFDRENGYDAPGSRIAVMDRNGQLYIAGESKLIRIDTKQLINGPVNIQKVMASSLQINHQDIPENVIREINRGISPINNKLKIRHFQRNWTFYFDIYNYINSAKDRFRYKLNGYDKDWSSWTDTRQANYTNLPPGEYEFVVESGNQSSLTEAGALSIAFTIPRPFWKMWLFQVFVTLAFLTSIVLVTRGFVDRKRKKQISAAQTKRKILELEMQALQSQMNPHFIYNCLNGMQYSILDNKTEELLDYLNDFSKVLRFSLENASLGFIPLEKEIEFLKSYLRLEQNRFPDLFDFRVLIKEDMINDHISIPPMMIQPFAENSIKHGFSQLTRKGVLAIEFEKAAPGTIRCTITDNGKGRQPGSPGNNVAAGNDRYHSTTIAEMRLRLHNHPGDPDKYRIIYTDLVENGSPGGLKVELLLPSGLTEQ